ncbi:MAG: NAD(P)-binding domain-containing protein [bacterium]|nr:NAD(P)-binding domain-containing protein [bacterium]
MKVAVIGCGNVGFAHLMWMKERGFDVLGYDIDPKVQEKVAKTIGESCVAYELKTLAICDSIHICVPTESAADGSADMSIYEGVVHGLASVFDNQHRVSVIQRSTCPPGSADRYAKCFGNNISYGVNPSFLRKSSIMQDTEHPERVAIGGHGLAVMHMEEIYRDITAPRYVTESRTSVELLKYIENTIDAMLVSYWNEILEYAVSLGLEVEEIIRLIEKIGDREKFQTVSRVPGKAFGLWCLPKDLKAIIFEMKKKDISPNLMEGVLDANIKYEQQNGIGMTPAQALWEMSNGHVQVLEEGKQQIKLYIKEKYNSAGKNG